MKHLVFKNLSFFLTIGGGDKEKLPHISRRSFSKIWGIFETCSNFSCPHNYGGLLLLTKTAKTF
jgi:hypothetical protein